MSPQPAGHALHDGGQPHRPGVGQHRASGRVGSAPHAVTTKSALTARSAAPAACRKDMPWGAPRPASDHRSPQRRLAHIENACGTAEPLLCRHRGERAKPGHGRLAPLGGDADKYGVIYHLCLTATSRHDGMSQPNALSALMMRRVMPLLTIGDQFPAYQLTALIGGDLSKVDAKQPGDYFTTITSDEHPGKWRVVFFGRKTSRSCALPRSRRSASSMTSSRTATPRSWGFD